jgi:hypothetical protein
VRRGDLAGGRGRMNAIYSLNNVAFELAEQ